MLTMIRDDDLNDPAKAALYGADAIAAERARRSQRTVFGHGDVVDLRGDDMPPRDPWDLEKSRLSYLFDAVAAAGLQANTPAIVGDYDRETRRRAQAAATAAQRSHWAVCVGATVTLKDGSVLSGGERIDEALIDHPHASEVLNVMRERGIVSMIDPDLAWLRSLPPEVGPWVATREVSFSNGKAFRRGDSVSEADCPARKLPRPITDDMKASELSVADVRRLIREEIDLRVPRPSLPPPMSEWALATLASAWGLAAVTVAPNFERSTPKKKGLFR